MELIEEFFKENTHGIIDSIIKLGGLIFVLRFFVKKSKKDDERQDEFDSKLDQINDGIHDIRKEGAIRDLKIKTLEKGVEENRQEIKEIRKAATHRK